MTHAHGSVARHPMMNNEPHPRDPPASFLLDEFYTPQELRSPPHNMYEDLCESSAGEEEQHTEDESSDFVKLANFVYSQVEESKGFSRAIPRPRPRFCTTDGEGFVHALSLVTTPNEFSQIRR